jgi:hypothetical protein
VTNEGTVGRSNQSNIDNLLINELNAILNIFTSIYNSILSILILAQKNPHIALITTLISIIITLLLILTYKGPFNGGGGFPPASLLPFLM